MLCSQRFQSLSLYANIQRVSWKWKGRKQEVQGISKNQEVQEDISEEEVQDMSRTRQEGELRKVIPIVKLEMAEKTVSRSTIGTISPVRRSTRVTTKASTGVNGTGKRK